MAANSNELSPTVFVKHRIACWLRYTPKCRMPAARVRITVSRLRRDAERAFEPAGDGTLPICGTISSDTSWRYC
jgi:hypothetical protein